MKGLRYKMREIVYEKVNFPETGRPAFVELSDETIEERYEKIKQGMKRRGLDCLIIYADKEHGSNFEYLTGFFPRFEEALLVIKNDENYLLLGNENMKMAAHARIKNKAICVPYFSLPNQPMENTVDLKGLLAMTGISSEMHIGIVGWKYFTSRFERNDQLYDVPYYIVDTLKTIVGETGLICNATDLFIKEARTINNANEIIHYMYGASLASGCIIDIMKNIEAGKNDLEMASLLDREGQLHTTVSIFASGERYEKANLFPRNKIIRPSDKISMSVGYKGGLSCRNGFAVKDASMLPEGQKDYMERVVKPYFNSYVEWLEKIKIGMSGKEMYDLIETCLPKNQYHWFLNPGHLIQDEEWLSSPIYADSCEILKSGMMFQVDIIPSIAGYHGVNCEEGIALADEKLRKEIRKNYPSEWQLIEKRRKYIKEQLNINISDEIIPLSCSLAYLNPYLLNKGYALKIK